MSFISETIRTRRHLRQSVRQLGESLGATPGLVAANLVALRVMGMPKHSTDCAVARYLGAIVGTERCVKAISVSDRSVHVTLMGGHVPLRVGLPKPVCKFIQGFDSGCYPDLIDLTPSPRAGQAVQSSRLGPNAAV
jgi:hypothetical protein